MKSFYVYGIQSVEHERIYIGQCGDLDVRLAHHNCGNVKSTKSFRPWKVIALQAVETREKARWIEFQLKKSRGKRLRWLDEFACKGVPS